MPPKPKSSTPVLATKHMDKRANIPIEELRDFVADDERPTYLAWMASRGKKGD